MIGRPSGYRRAEFELTILRARNSALAVDDQRPGRPAYRRQFWDASDCPMDPELIGERSTAIVPEMIVVLTSRVSATSAS
jgi:hypothetical protein